jgi:tetratricopeptide (TPR) repeat protein
MRCEMIYSHFLPRWLEISAYSKGGRACLKFLLLGVGCVVFVLSYTQWERGQLVFQAKFPQIVWRGVESISDDYLYEGVALSTQGRIDSALFWYDKAIETDPHNWTAFTKKAVALSLQGNLREAVKLFDVVLIEQPRNVEALLGKAGTLSLLQDYDVAEAVYDLVLAENPENVEALIGKGIILVKYQRFSDAIRIFDKLAFLVPMDTEVQFYRAMVLQKIGQKETAFYLLGRVIEQQPENEDAWAAYQVLEKELGFGQFKIAE